jgi:hypothetical protein
MKRALFNHLNLQIGLMLTRFRFLTNPRFDPIPLKAPGFSNTECGQVTLARHLIDFRIAGFQVTGKIMHSQDLGGKGWCKLILHKASIHLASSDMVLCGAKRTGFIMRKIIHGK